MFFQFDEVARDTDTDAEVTQVEDDFVEFQENRRFHSKPPSKARSNVAKYVAKSVRSDVGESSGSAPLTTSSAVSATETASSLTSVTDISSDLIPGNLSKDTITTEPSDGKLLFHCASSCPTF